MTLLIRNMLSVWYAVFCLAAMGVLVLSLMAFLVAGKELDFDIAKIFAGFTNILYWGILLSGGVMAAMAIVFTIVQIAVLDLHSSEATRIVEEGRRYRRLLLLLMSIGLAIGSAWMFSFIGEYVGNGGSIRHYSIFACVLALFAAFGSYIFWKLLRNFEIVAPHFAPGR